VLQQTYSDVHSESKAARTNKDLCSCSHPSSTILFLNIQTINNFPTKTFYILQLKAPFRWEAGAASFLAWISGDRVAVKKDEQNPSASARGRVHERGRARGVLGERVRSRLRSSISPRIQINHPPLVENELRGDDNRFPSETRLSQLVKRKRKWKLTSQL